MDNIIPRIGSFPDAHWMDGGSGRVLNSDGPYVSLDGCVKITGLISASGDDNNLLVNGMNLGITMPGVECCNNPLGAT